MYTSFDKCHDDLYVHFTLNVQSFKNCDTSVAYDVDYVCKKEEKKLICNLS